MYSGESGTGYEPGLSEPSDQELGRRTVIELFGPDSRYPGHNDRLLATLAKHNLDTPGMELAIEMHDVVDRLVDPPDEPTRRKAVELLTDLHNNQVSDRYTLQYAIGCGISASLWEEEVGEAWRSEVATLFNDRPEHERKMLIAASDPKEARKINIDIRVLKSAGIRRFDTTALRRSMLKRDVEAPAINLIEFIDNFDNPPPNNPASTHRDCIETLTALGPATSLYGMTSLSSEGRGKALEFFYDDPEIVAKGRIQHELSVTYIDLLEDTVITPAIDGAIADILESEALEELVRTEIVSDYRTDYLEAEIQQHGSRRVKSVGSISKKHAVKFKDKANSQVSDGIGYKRLLPDYFDEETVHAFAEAVAARITASGHNGSIELRHPVEGEPAFEDLINNPRSSGYRSIHLAFMAHIDGETVPFELHILRHKDEKGNTYDWAAHDLFKTGVEGTKQIVDDLRTIGPRAKHVRDKSANQVLNPNGWFEMIKRLPELDTPMHEIYSLVEIGNARILLPNGLADFARETLQDAGLEGDIFLPPENLTKTQFIDLVCSIDPDLRDDPQITRALELLESLELPFRHNGVSQLEGHLMPAAFHGALMAAQTAMHWGSDGNPTEYLSDNITALLLHDSVEDLAAVSQALITEKYSAAVSGLVLPMTSLSHITDEDTRRAANAQQLADNPLALIMKISDRMQNHITDISYLVKTKEPSKSALSFIFSYFKKTDKQLTKKFDAQPMPDEYHQVHQMIMAMGRTLMIKYKQ